MLIRKICAKLFIFRSSMVLLYGMHSRSCLLLLILAFNCYDCSDISPKNEYASILKEKDVMELINDAKMSDIFTLNGKYDIDDDKNYEDSKYNSACAINRKTLCYYRSVYFSICCLKVGNDELSIAKNLLHKEIKKMVQIKKESMLEVSFRVSKIGAVSGLSSAVKVVCELLNVINTARNSVRETRTVEFSIEDLETAILTATSTIEMAIGVLSEIMERKRENTIIMGLEVIQAAAEVASSIALGNSERDAAGLATIAIVTSIVSIAAAGSTAVEVAEKAAKSAVYASSVASFIAHSTKEPAVVLQAVMASQSAAAVATAVSRAAISINESGKTWNFFSQAIAPAIATATAAAVAAAKAIAPTLLEAHYQILLAHSRVCTALKVTIIGIHFFDTITQELEQFVSFLQSNPIGAIEESTIFAQKIVDNLLNNNAEKTVLSLIKRQELTEVRAIDSFTNGDLCMYKGHAFCFILYMLAKVITANYDARRNINSGYVSKSVFTFMNEFHLLQIKLRNDAVFCLTMLEIIRKTLNIIINLSSFKNYFDNHRNQYENLIRFLRPNHCKWITENACNNEDTVKQRKCLYFLKCTVKLRCYIFIAYRLAYNMEKAIHKKLVPYKMREKILFDFIQEEIKIELNKLDTLISVISNKILENKKNKK